MNTPNPLQPQGTLDATSSPKSRFRVTVLTILALHVVFIGGLLLQGCDKRVPPSTGTTVSNAVASLPPLDNTNYFSSFPGDTLAPSTSSVPPASQSPAPLRQAPLPALGSTGGGGTGAGPGAGSLNQPAAAPNYANTASSEHVIQKGDTIGALATKYGVSVQSILDANPDVKPKNLKVAARLVIPPGGTPSAAASHDGPAVPP